MVTGLFFGIGVNNGCSTRCSLLACVRVCPGPDATEFTLGLAQLCFMTREREDAPGPEEKENVVASFCSDKPSFLYVAIFGNSNKNNMKNNRNCNPRYNRYEVRALAPGAG